MIIDDRKPNTKGGWDRPVIRRVLTGMGGLLLAVGIGTAPVKADPAVTYIAIGAIATVIPGMIFNPEQPDAEREFFGVGGGVFDIVDDEDQAGLFRAEYTSPWTFFRVKPFGGIAGTTDSGFLGYVGFKHDLNIGRNLVISANIAAAGYSAGDGKDLGSSVVLRSGLELGYRFDNGVLVSGSFHHMSHGEIFDEVNPGTETAALTISVPTDTLFRGQIFEGKHLWPKLFGR